MYRCLFILTLLLALAGCSQMTEDTITFYSEPTLERTEPESAQTYHLTSAQVRQLRRILSHVSEWTDDNAVNRDSYFFDGEWDIDTTAYYFSYNPCVIYYDHYLAGTAEGLTEEDMAYIRGLDPDEKS